MFGTYEETHWFDFDLVSVYMTGLAYLSVHFYYNASVINQNELEN
jgi:uncharacterized membrane protein